MNATVSIPCPDGVILGVSRVGALLVYPADINKGETVEFYYAHGSHHGTRTVLVLKSDDNGIEGINLERDGEYRKYSDEYVSDYYKVVKPFVQVELASTSEKRIRFDDALEALRASLSGEQLAELYSKHVALLGDGASFDAQTGEVVVKLPVPKENTFLRIGADNDSQSLVIENKHGQTFHLFVYGKLNTVGITAPGFNNTKVTPDELRDQLVKFLA